jgi:hypothetical protein
MYHWEINMILLDEGSNVAPDGMMTHERRRPGRTEEASPSLRPLLRDPLLRPPAFLPQSKDEGGECALSQELNEDDLRTARGMILNLATAALLWCCVGVIWFLISLTLVHSG